MTRIHHIQRLTVQPEDVLVLALPDTADPEEITRLMGVMAENFPGRRVVIRAPGSHLLALCPDCADALPSDAGTVSIS